MKFVIIQSMELDPGGPKETTRTERRRAETRARIVQAAERLMRERGVEAVTIHDITEAADVGHGTFYLHFEAKADVLRPVVDRLADRLHERVNQLTRGAEDPALRLATGIRIALRMIVSDPLWNWYVFRSGTPFRRMEEGMGAPPVEDMDRGLASGRFRAENRRAIWSFVDGAVTGVLIALDEGRVGDEAMDLTAEMVLRSLGVDVEEAARIAHTPLEVH